MASRHQKGLGCGLLTALLTVTSSCMFADFQTEIVDKGTPENNLQQAMAAVAVPPMPISVYDLQMRNFPNIRRSIVKTFDFMALDLAKVETAVSKFHNFDELIGFKVEVQFPDINNLYFIHPDQTHLQSITKITFKEQSLPPIGFYTQQIIMRIVHFLEPLTTSLYRPLAMKMICCCFGSAK